MPHVLLDTNVVVLLPRLGSLPGDPKRASISTVTLAELSVGPLVTDDPTLRARRQQDLQLAEALFRPIPFDAPSARVFASVAARLRSSGRTRRARSFDTLIAATAIAHDLPLYTADPDDFAGIPELTVVEVPVP